MKKAILICFIGIDGSGKTTHAKNLENYLKEHRISCKYLWCGWRQFEFFLFRPIIGFVKLLNKKLLNKYKDCNEDNRNENNKNENNKNENNKNENSRNENSRNKNSRNKKFDYLQYFAIFDYVLRVIPRIFLSLYRYDYIITDRYIFDVIVGFSINHSENMFRKIFWIFPKPNMIFYIDIPENIAFSRKNDIPSIEYLRKRKCIYDKFMIEFNAQFLDGTKSIEEISNTIQKVVIN